jgi:hypothetical protein
MIDVNRFSLLWFSVLRGFRWRADRHSRRGRFPLHRLHESHRELGRYSASRRETFLSRRRRLNTVIGEQRSRRARSTSDMAPSSRSLAGVQANGFPPAARFVNAAMPSRSRMIATANTVRPVLSATSLSFIVPSSANSSGFHGSPATSGLVPRSLCDALIFVRVALLAFLPMFARRIVSMTCLGRGWPVLAAEIFAARSF